MSLDEHYRTARVVGEALETRLRISFATDKPHRLWHATMDLLTVRYFQVVGPDGTLVISFSKRMRGPNTAALPLNS